MKIRKCQGEKMKKLLEKVRTPEKGGSVKNKILITIVIMLFGLGLGIVQKWIDGSSDDVLPVCLQIMDIRNYFGRLAIWILLATVISIYSKSPLKAAINTFLFFISMLAGYYFYCNYVLGFLPRTYMMIWIAVSFFTFFLAYMCWYAKGEGIIAIVISSIIIGVLFAQAFSITQGFYVYHLSEVITWMIAIVVLKRKPSELIIELGLSFIVAFFYQLVIPHWG